MKNEKQVSGNWSNIVKEKMADQKISIKMLIELTGVSQTTMYAFLNGERNLGIDKMQKIWNALKIEL